MRYGGIAAYGVAVTSILYAVVYLGFVRPNPDPANNAAAIAWSLIAVGALLGAAATGAVGAFVGGSAGTRLSAFGVTYSLLSATHGVFAALYNVQGSPDLDISPTDPRGFATFGLAGVWLIVAGRTLAARTDLRRLYSQLAITAGIDLVLLFIATVIGSAPLILVFGGLASVVLGPIFWAMTGRLLTASAG